MLLYFPHGFVVNSPPSVVLSLHRSGSSYFDLMVCIKLTGLNCSCSVIVLKAFSVPRAFAGKRMHVDVGPGQREENL